jgi:hypothetical protein
LTLDTVVLDTLRIAKAVRVHLNEVNCNHSIQEIVREALGPFASISPIPNSTDGDGVDNPNLRNDYRR